jgi:ribosomal protein L11 methyltransferase
MRGFFFVFMFLLSVGHRAGEVFGQGVGDGRIEGQRLAIASPWLHDQRAHFIGPFSLIIANLTLKDLLPLAGIFKKLLSPGGILVTSGILNSQARTLLRAFGREKIPLQYLILEEEWACVVFQSNR